LGDQAPPDHAGCAGNEHSHRESKVPSCPRRTRNLLGSSAYFRSPGRLFSCAPRSAIVQSWPHARADTQLRALKISTSGRHWSIRMQVLVLGGDGYLGWPTALHLSALGHEVAVNDNFARRGYDEEMGVESLVPISTLEERIATWAEISGRTIKAYVGDLCDGAFVHQIVSDFRPDTIVHFGEQRAAPYSMIDQAHAVYTQTNNVVGTLNVMYAIADIDRDIHLVKLGTMGEYGTPNIDIDEGRLEVEHRGRKERVMYRNLP